MRYRSWKAEKERRVEPLGIVLKGGSWYLVGQVDGDARTYRISRILELNVLDERFEWPESFDLKAYWTDSTRRLEEELHQGSATVRLSPWGVKLMEAFISPFVRAGTKISDEANSAGWRMATMPIGSMWHSATELLRFGAEVEVLEPPELRSKMTEITAGLNRIYCGSSPAEYAKSRLSTEAVIVAASDNRKSRGPTTSSG